MLSTASRHLVCGVCEQLDSTSADILSRACDGDSAALAELLQTHTPMLYAELRSRIPDGLRPLLAVEDVLQETYTDVFLSIRGFIPRGDGAFLGWFRKLAQNNLLEAIRGLDADKRGGGKRPVSFSIGSDAQTDLIGALLPAATQTTPSQHVSRQEARSSLEAALAQLPQHYRLAVQRYDLDGRTIDETAAELNCSPGGVHLIRHRAFKQLRKLLEKLTVTTFATF